MAVDATTSGRYQHALAGEPLPAAFVDLDAIDANIDRILRPLRGGRKQLRVATKSLRCPALVGRVAARGGAIVGGLMTYTAVETAYYASEGAAIIGPASRDLLLAYPTLEPADAAALACANREAHSAVVVDDARQLVPLAAAARAAGTRIPVVIDVDMSWRPVAGVQIGARRSPLRDPGDVVTLARAIAAEPSLGFDGVMCYEAQIAGVPDAAPFAAWQNPIRRALKRGSRPAVSRARAAVVDALRAAALPPTVVNGGGTGSVDWSAREAS
jgi:D-serine deaminase-like pyridoxal phosphate-dependent protein